MRILLVICCFLVSSSAFAETSYSIKDPKIIQALQSYIKIFGYSCDEVDHADRLPWNDNFSVWCKKNGYLKYHYELEDRGGKYIVHVK